MDQQTERAAAAIREADALLITAGAGMGVDSGLPDFRGATGFWRAYPAIAELGLRFEEMSQPRWFDEAPALAWAFYGHPMNLYRSTTPHAGLRQLLEVGSQKVHGYFVFTSNVDGHFQKAGFDPERIVECHGSLNYFQCSDPCSEDAWDAVYETVTIDEVAFRALPPLPLCPHCTGLARPNVMMFSDGSWNPERTDQQQARFQSWLRTLQHAGAKLAVVEVGAGTAVPSVRLRSEWLADDLEATAHWACP